MSSGDDHDTGDRPNPLAASSHSLTDEQAAALDLNRNIAVTAAAGTGKTTALTARYLQILREHEALLPPEIVTITFTRKAATEMRERIRKNVQAQLAQVDSEAAFTRWRQVADQLSDGYIHTIDAFCARILREYAIEAGVDPGFSVLDEVDAGVVRQDAVTQYLDQESGSNDALKLIARVYDRDTLSDLLHGLLSEPRESDAWAEARAEQSDAEYLDVLFETFCQMEGDTARAILSRSDVQEALELFRELDLDALGVPRDGYARPSFDPFLEPAAEMAGGREPTAASDRDCLRALRRLFGGLLTSNGTLYKSPSYHIIGTNANWSNAPHDAYADAIETLLETCREFEAEIRTIPGIVDENSVEYVRALAEVYEGVRETYSTLKTERDAFDFADLLGRTTRLLRANEDVRRELRSRFAYLMVDEFQDTDPRQWELVQLLSSDQLETFDGENVFVVGDKKQSIYRFRGADVSTFVTARADLVEANRTADKAGPTDLDLTGSFRTLEGVVDVLNPLFDNVFGPLGDEYLPYEAEPQRLAPTRPTGTDIEGEVEYLVVPEDAEAAEQLYPATHPLQDRPYFDAGDREAQAVAARVSQVLASGTEIYNEDKSEYRAAKPQDIAILIRTRKNLEAYERAFDERGIDLNVISGAGYWNTPEIRTLTNLLEVLYDPTQDIQLYGLLRSPLFGFTDSELVPAVAGGDVWESLETAATPALQNAYAQLSKWRSWYTTPRAAQGEDAELGYLPVNKLLTAVFEETGYLASIGAGERGQQAIANARKFRERVRGWTEQGIRTLPALRQRIRRQRAEADKERDAELPDEERGVRVLTVHAAKGLEFPITVVPELGREFNFDGTVDDRRQALLGRPPEAPDEQVPFVGIQAPSHPDSYESSATLARSELQAAHRRELRAEEKRTLYVAATRTRDHLILSGTHALTEKSEHQDEGTEEEPETYLTFTDPADPADAKRWRDWVQPALLAEGREIINALQETGVTTRHIDTGEYTIRIPPEPIDRTATPAAVEAIEWDLEPTDTAAPPLTTTATSLVSRLHGTADAPDGAGFTPPEFEWNVPAAAREIPSVDSETAPEANDLGTIVHGVCEFDPTPADRDEIVARLAAGMGLKLDEHAVDHIRAHADRGIAFHRAAAATFTDPTVYHEFPATVRLGDRRVIGEIDYLAVTDEGFHIIDYKTNRISEDGGVDQLAAHYQPQLETYAAAVLQHDPSKRVTATLYFTRADEARQLTFDEAASARSTVEDRLVAYLDRVDAE